MMQRSAIIEPRPDTVMVHIYLIVTVVVSIYEERNKDLL